jgi:hypothetical protein
MAFIASAALKAAPAAFVFYPKVLRKFGQYNEIITNFCYRSFSIGFTINASAAWKLIDLRRVRQGPGRGR